MPPCFCIGWPPDGVITAYLASGGLVPQHPPPPAGIYVIRPPGPDPSRKVRVLTELLIECFDQASSADRDGLASYPA